MSHAGQADRELDDLIAEITIDCYDEDEGMQAFEDAFDEDASFPFAATVLGENVEVLSVGQRNGRHGLIATCARAGHRYNVALLDVSIDAEPPVSRLLAAYRRWLAT